MNFPTFLCVGAQKAGTSWLHHHLQSHPAIWMPPVKELHYFDHLFVPRNRRWTAWHIRQGVHNALKSHVRDNEKIDFSYVKYLADLATRNIFTEEWYRNAFSLPQATNKMTGEITPVYCTIGPSGVNYVRNLLGAVRIIYLIRDPIDRAISQLRMNMKRHGPKRPDRNAWMEFAADSEIVQRGAYSTYIPQWQKLFAPDDLLFIPYGNIRDRPEAVLRSVEKFLGLEPHTYASAAKRIHESGGGLPPTDVYRFLEERFRHERQWLQQHFGQSFAEATR